MPDPDSTPGRAHPASAYWRRRAVLGGGLALAGYEALRALGLTGGKGAPRAVPTTTTTATTTTPPAKPPTVTGDARNIIQIENAKPGTTDFAFPFDDDVDNRIEGYANTDSARRGDNVRLFVSTTGTTFTVEAFRFGHYGGAGARRVWAKPTPVVGSLQAPPSIDPLTNMRECQWLPSVDVTVVPCGAPPSTVCRCSDVPGRHLTITLAVAAFLSRMKGDGSGRTMCTRA